MKFSLLAAMEVNILTTSSAASDGKCHQKWWYFHFSDTWFLKKWHHMSIMVPQIIGNLHVCLTACSSWHQRKHYITGPLWGGSMDQWFSLTKEPLIRKMCKNHYNQGQDHRATNIYIYTYNSLHIKGLAQDCSNSIANALELLRSCTKPSIWYLTPGVLLGWYSKTYFLPELPGILGRDLASCFVHCSIQLHRGWRQGRRP